MLHSLPLSHSLSDSLFFLSFFLSPYLSQSFAGISISDSSSDSFASSVSYAISAVLDMQATSTIRLLARTGKPLKNTRTETETETMKVSTSMDILSEGAMTPVSLEITVNVTCIWKPVDVIVKLQRSMDRGEFLVLLANDLGLSIRNTTRAVFVDVTPTFGPSPSPTIKRSSAPINSNLKQGDY